MEDADYTDQRSAAAAHKTRRLKRNNKTEQPSSSPEAQEHLAADSIKPGDPLSPPDMADLENEDIQDDGIYPGGKPTEQEFEILYDTWQLMNRLGLEFDRINHQGLWEKFEHEYSIWLATVPKGNSTGETPNIPSTLELEECLKKAEANVANHAKIGAYLTDKLRSLETSLDEAGKGTTLMRDQPSLWY
jgi:hypothetical protein